MPLVRTLQATAVRLAAVVLPLLVSGAALAATDRRAVQGAAQDLGPAVPEPASILLYAAGVLVVGYGAHRLHQRNR